jgi:pimeloyl-ACP methyl ester carboxylesterase
MHKKRRLFTIASSVAVVMGVLSPAIVDSGQAGAVANGGAAGVVPKPASVAWGPCTDPNLQQFHAQCGFVSVPLDYSHPGGQKIKIAVSRIKHTAAGQNYQGAILTNPGGPGGSGLGLNPFLIAALQAEGYSAAAADYDWVGFDPRGVGSSEPAISCIPNYFRPDRPNYVPFTSGLLNYWLATSQSYAQACDGVNPLQSALLRNMTTQDVAMDIDSIRQALGQAQITYYGFSYGTDIGQTYSTLFPSHVRRLIMDSNVNPLRIGYHTFNLDQDIPFNSNENAWFGWIAKYNSVYHLGTTEAAVQQSFYAAEAALHTHPAGGKVGPDEWVDLFIEPAYYEQTWVQFAKPFADWVHNHNAAAAKELIALYTAVDAPGNDNGFAVYLGVICTDSHWPLNWSVWNQDLWSTYNKAPFETWGNGWFNAPCIFWPAPSVPHLRINGTGISSALLIDETHDAATPFSGSLVTRKLFPNSVLLAEPGGTTHADSLSGNKCVDGTIAAYLETGKLPPRDSDAPWDKTCPPLPQPVPTAGNMQPASQVMARFGGNPRFGFLP